MRLQVSGSKIDQPAASDSSSGLPHSRQIPLCRRARVAKRLRCLIMVTVACVITLPGCHDTSLQPTPRGPEWVVYTTSNSPLPAGSINCLAVDGDGTVWMGTDSGASGFLRNGWSTLKDSLSWIEIGPDRIARVHSRVTSIAVGKDHSLWFGLDGGGVKRWNRNATTKTWQTFTTPSLTINVVRSVASDRYQTGDVWVGTDSGLCRFVQSQNDPTQGVWMKYGSPDLPSSRVLAVTVDAVNGFTYVGTHDGLALADAYLSWRQLQFPPDYQYPIVAIAYDVSNTVWLGKWMGATSLRNNYLITHFTNQNTKGMLPWGPVNAIATDFHTDRWFGTNYGLAELNDTTWRRFDQRNTLLPSDVVTALVYDLEGNLWIGTSAGIAVYNPRGTKF